MSWTKKHFISIFYSVFIVFVEGFFYEDQEFTELNVMIVVSSAFVYFS